MSIHCRNTRTFTMKRQAKKESASFSFGRGVNLERLSSPSAVSRCHDDLRRLGKAQLPRGTLGACSFFRRRLWLALLFLLRLFALLFGGSGLCLLSLALFCGFRFRFLLSLALLCGFLFNFLLSLSLFLQLPPPLPPEPFAFLWLPTPRPPEPVAFLRLPLPLARLARQRLAA